MTDTIERSTVPSTSPSPVHKPLPRLRNQNYQPEENWLDRPVRVFHVREGAQGDDSNFVVLGSKSSEALARMLRQLEVMGFYPTDIVGITQDAKIDDFAWPRNLEWKTLPRICTPSFRNLYGHFTAFDQFGEMQHIPRGGLDWEDETEIVRSSTRILVVAASDLNARVKAGVARLIKGHPSLVVMHFNGAELHAVAAEALSEAEKIYSADARFIFNHAVNMVVITSRAFLKCARESGYSQADVLSSSPRLDRYNWKLGHPLSLQALYAIDELGSADTDETPFVSYVDKGRLPWLMTHSLPFFEATKDGHSFIWRGTGHYPAWEQPLGRVAAGHAVDRKGIHIPQHWIFHILQSLYSAGYVGVFGDKVRITRNGKAFLSLIGFDAKDPDVLLRWRMNGMFGSADDVPSMDRWINRSFRSIKRKVAGLAASPITEVVDTAWPPIATNNLYVWGVTTPIGSGTMPEDRETSLIAHVTAHEKATDIRERRRGLIKHHIGFGEPAKIIGVWAGVPVAVEPEGNQKLSRLDLFKDWKSLDQDFEAAIAAIPDWPTAGVEPGLVTAGPTDEAILDIHVPAKIADIDDNSPVSKVYRGHVLVLDNLDLCETELRRYASHQSLGRMIPNYDFTDGAKTFGYGKSMTMVYGMLVGYQDTVGGSILVQRRVSEIRVRNMDAMIGRWRNDIPMVFGHENMSGYGDWLVTPSGVVSPVDTHNAASSNVVLI